MEEQREKGAKMGRQKQKNDILILDHLKNILAWMDLNVFKAEKDKYSWK